MVAGQLDRLMDQLRAEMQPLFQALQSEAGFGITDKEYEHLCDELS